MAYHNPDNLRLEIEVAPTGLPNLVRNPSGQYGSWGWETPVANTAIVEWSTGLRFNNSAAQAAYFQTEKMTVGAGKYVTGRLDLFGGSSGYFCRTRLDFYNSAGALISSGTYSGYTSVLGTTIYAPITLSPAGTSHVRMRVDLYSNNTGSNPAGNTSVFFRSGMVTWQNTNTFSSSITNLSTNPSFENNTTGWSAINASMSRTTGTSFVGTSKLEFTITANGTGTTNSGGVTTDFPVSAGTDYVAQVYARSVTAAERITLGLYFYDASGNVVGSSPRTGPSLTTTYTRYATNVATAPSGAVTGRFSVGTFRSDGSASTPIYLDAVTIRSGSDTSLAYFDGSTTSTSAYSYAWTGTAGNSTSTASSTTGTFDYTEPITWRNIIGPTYSIQFSRQEFNLGTLTASIKDPLLDPATSTAITRGSAIRLSSLVNGVWEPAFTGTITTARTSYPRNSAGGTDTLIEVSAADNMNALANQQEARGVQNINDLPFILEGKGVPWKVNGTGSQVSSATVVANNGNASVADQVEVTRATGHGFAWVDRNNILNVWSPNVISSVAVAEFSDTGAVGTLGYKDIDVDFDLDRFVNSVNVTWLRYDIGTNSTTEVAYGPYINQASIDQYGPRSSEFTIQGATEDGAAIASYAQYILDRNSTPVIKANSLTMPVRDADTAAKAALLDVCSPVKVVYSNKVNSTYRISEINQTITPEAWSVTYSFGTTSSVPAPSEVPTPPFNGVTSAPYAYALRTAAGSIPNNAWTVVGFPNNQVLEGGFTYDVTNGFFTVPKSGIYHISGQVLLASSTAGYRAAAIYINGGAATAGYRYNAPNASGLASASMDAVLRLTAGDTVAFYVNQNSGGALALNVSSAGFNRISMARVAD